MTDQPEEIKKEKELDGPLLAKERGKTVEKESQEKPKGGVKEEVGQEKTKEKAKEEVKKEIGQEIQEPSLVEKKSGPRILLIEDDPPMVKMYSTKLKMEGFEVEVAYDGEKGLTMAKEWKPDLVVLDLMIPKIGGMDVLEQLKADSKTKNLPVVILSNLSQEQDIQRAQRLGVVEFLIKANFTPGQVVEKIRGHLRK